MVILKSVTFAISIPLNVKLLLLEFIHLALELLYFKPDE